MSVQSLFTPISLQPAQEGSQACRQRTIYPYFKIVLLKNLFTISMSVQSLFTPISLQPVQEGSQACRQRTIYPYFKIVFLKNLFTIRLSLLEPNFSPFLYQSEDERLYLFFSQRSISYISFINNYICYCYNLNMQTTLPPNTESFPQTGTLFLSITPTFLNCSVPSIKYSLKLWGVPESIDLEQALPSQSSQREKKLEPCSKTFKITTNLPKLTQYFSDMSVMIIEVKDARSQKEFGKGFVKIKRYIINGLFSEFQDRVQIVSIDESRNRRKIIGEVVIKLTLNVPMQVPKNTLQIKEHFNNSDQNIKRPFNTNKIIDHEIQHNTRKLVVQPHIFEETNLKQFVIDGYRQSQQKFDERREQERENNVDIKDILMAMKTRPKVKINAENVLNFLEQDSIHNYPDIDHLTKKYGRNNVCAERMRLKLDQAKYLSSQKLIQHSNEGQQPRKEGFIIKFRNVQHLVSNNGGHSEFQVIHLDSERDHTVLNQLMIKDLAQGGFYVKNLATGNVIDLQNKTLKGKCTLKRANLQGQPVKISLKRKDNNKKVIEFDISIEDLSKLLPQSSPQRKNTQQNGAKLLDQDLKKGKSHFYISIKPLNESKYKQYVFTLHPQCQKQKVKGKKMIFTAGNTNQNIKITVQDERNGILQELMVNTDPSIKLKEETVAIGKEKFSIFMGSAETIQNLMKIVILHDGNKSHQSESQLKRGKEQQMQQQFKKRSSETSVMQISRQQKLRLLLECFQSLIQTTNSQCMTLIKKLSVPSLTYDEQLNLFEKLCINSGTPQPQATTESGFKQLLHGQFSMFWSCFQQYKRWNQLYWHSLAVAKSALWKVLKDCAAIINERGSYYGRNSSQNRKYITNMMEKSIQKLYRNKQTLFGLTPIQICQINLLEIYKDRLMDEVEKSQINIQSNLQIKRQNMIELEPKIKSILSLLCRYASSSNETKLCHCIRLDELATILLGNAQQCRLYINEHQILAILGHKEADQQMQLLFQVVSSCIGENDLTDAHCGNLKNLLRQYERMETEESSRRQEEQNRIQTEGNTRKIETQQHERLHTQQIQENKKKTESDIPQFPSSTQLKPFKIYLTSLELKPDSNKFVTIAEMDGSVIEILDSDSKHILFTFKYSELPNSITLHLMQDYRVLVKVYQNQQGKSVEIWKFQGVFIANQKLQKILLYYANKEGNQQIGFINVNFQKIHGQKEHDDQVVIQIRNETVFQQKPSQEGKQYPYHEIKNVQNERKRLTKQVGGKFLACPIIWYKILSITPSLRENEEYTIIIQGAEHLINYPNLHACGKIYNKDVQKDKIMIKAENFNGLKFEEPFSKKTGVHQICVNRADGTVGCVLAIQLQEYIGDEVVEKQEENIQRVVLFNIYHLEFLAKLDGNSQFTIVITTQSNQQPVFIKNFASRAKSLGIEGGPLRHVWIGLSTRVDVSKKYDICIYLKTKGLKYSEQDLIAHFEFKIKFHPDQIGIFSNKGYLIDQKGYRLALTAFQLNYNDVFSKDPVGRQKFEQLLSIFSVQNIIKLQKQLPSPDKVQSVLQKNFGFNNTQLHLLLSLQKHDQEIFTIISRWDVDELLSKYEINLKSNSISDLYSQFQIYDFRNRGIIPKSKAELVNVLVFGKKGKEFQRNGIDFNKLEVGNKEGWLKDLKEVQSNEEIDYMLVLWCLRQHATADGFFFADQPNSISKDPKKGQNETTNPNNTSNDSISKIKPMKISLLCYKNLKINNLPATLTFYINGEKVAEPIPRCFTHDYQNPKPIIATYPILLEIYNKKYGVRELYSEQLVESVRVYEEKVHVLGGVIFFMIQQEGQSSMNVPKPTPNKKQPSPTKKQDLSNTNSNFRQSRRQKWQNMKQSRQSTQKIIDVLSSFTS